MGMKELDDAAAADADDQAQLDSEATMEESKERRLTSEETNIEVLRRSQADDEVAGKGRRKSFRDRMNEGAQYWHGRLSGAQKPGSRANVLFNFPTDDGGKGLETIKVPDDTASVTTIVTKDEAETTAPIPMQTGQSNNAAATPTNEEVSLEQSAEQEP